MSTLGPLKQLKIPKYSAQSFFLKGTLATLGRLGGLGVGFGLEDLVLVSAFGLRA